MTKTEFVSDDLLSKIYQNKYSPGEKLPTERDLATHYQVSRYTIRHAIKKLLNIGCVRVVQGSGIFVTDTKYKSPLIYNSLTEKKFNEIESKIIHLKKVQATPLLEKTFDLKQQDLWEYKRIRIVDYQKVQIETSLLPFHLFPDLTEEILAKSVHHYVQQCGFHISHFITTYSAVSITRDEAALLNCKKGIPAMKIMNRGILDDGRVFEYSELVNLDYTVSYFTPFNSEHHQQRLNRD
ncbi:GntR family transcriptional regulator [Alkalicoccobacillus gibsonii]|uniref:GntR family transcriptional regulator n=1 Tax=Alkalicoccobacillus gibsonii TaxID=79881 RepID=UPI001932BA5C|nr:GntR family transcriptional regulator [Alkalicoccobacillus gibsonii]MBM0065593.1 GntR family transcriptional regulator [Alkalicoccobacillus gibsonii]